MNTPTFGWRPTIALMTFAFAGAVFVSLTGDTVVMTVRVGVVFAAMLAMVAGVISLAPVLDARPRHQPAPIAAGVPSNAQGAPVHDWMADLLDSPPAAATQPAEAEQPAATQLLVDVDTGELVGDRVARLEERMADLTREVLDLSTVVQDQAELTAKAFGTLRREVERIGHVFTEDSDAA